ncbi:aldehyde dehydrogenase family protein [Neorhizobium sp. R1-B]|jgi:succinate-semialdehyde dehydrogenase/glutarate-semialdehyde dehydrogenase|nr:aldehyde dehydrogenase family protein [Neorhizobium sp. S3-V5DH]TDX82251.1 aldehyde dehydrogenase family protein [Neorhizobium sp. R1-B]
MLHAANGLEFGLSAYVFTQVGKCQRRLVDALQYGAVSVNSSLTHLCQSQ